MLLIRNEVGLSEGTTNPVTLKVLSWNVAGLSVESTDLFLSQISTLTACDILLLLECLINFVGVNVGAHELFTHRDAPTSHHTSAMERTSESCWQSEQMDCSRAGWTVDCHYGPSASQRQEVGRIRDGPGGNPGFHETEIMLILGGDFNASFYGQTFITWVSRYRVRER